MTTMHWTIKAGMATGIAAAMLLSGCAHRADTKAQFGDTVRHMTEQQIYDLDAAYNPDPEPLMGGDVVRLNDVLDSHRNNAEDLTEDRGALEMRDFN
jgi:hypothetical protein